MTALADLSAVTRARWGSTEIAEMYFGGAKVWDRVLGIVSRAPNGFIHPFIPGVTLFQDAAGTVPVTGFEQPVGLCLDVSPWARHLRQTTALNRPIWRQDEQGFGHLDFNGTNHWMRSDLFEWGTREVTLAVGFRRTSIVGFRTVIAFGTNLNQQNANGQWALFSATNNPNIQFRSLGITQTQTNLTRVDDYTGVILARAQNSGIHPSFMRDQLGTATTAALSSAGTPYGLNPLNLGSDSIGNIRMQGRVYPFVAAASLLAQSDEDALTAWATRRTTGALS